MAIVTNTMLEALRVGFRADFEEGKAKAQPQWQLAATHVPSSSASNTYGWLGQFPKLKEWIGSRVFQDIAEHEYTVANKLYEATVSIPLTAIEDDELGVYKPLYLEMGYAAAIHPDELVFKLLAEGHTTKCYDGHNFFDTAHVIYENEDGSGAETTVSNSLSPTASGVKNVAVDPVAPWFLLDVSRPLRPLLFQERSLPELQVITNPENEHVFTTDSIPFGVRYRCNAGYGFWQMAVRSTEPLNAESFERALMTIRSFTADGGRPLGLGRGGKEGLVLVVPSVHLSSARKVIVAERLDNGSSNIWYDSATIIDCPWLG